MFKFNYSYFLFAVLLLFTEIWIAHLMHDTFIRPYGGDFLVVVLLYCSIKSVVASDVKWTALFVLLVSYLIETLQYLHFIRRLGLENNTLARLILGITFEWTDILAYSLGILLILILEHLAGRSKTEASEEANASADVCTKSDTYNPTL